MQQEKAANEESQELDGENFKNKSLIMKLLAGYRITMETNLNSVNL